MSKDDPSMPRIRRLVGARRLLVATIGAATVNYAGCGNDEMSLVANLMAAPFMPPPNGGEAGRGGPPVVPNPDGFASVPPAADQDGGVPGDDSAANSGDPGPRP